MLYIDDIKTIVVERLPISLVTHSNFSGMVYTLCYLMKDVAIYDCETLPVYSDRGDDYYQKAKATLERLQSAMDRLRGACDVVTAIAGEGPLELFEVLYEVINEYIIPSIQYIYQS